jgi:Mn2+/Fe2+ NRAMP family transporter
MNWPSIAGVLNTVEQVSMDTCGLILSTVGVIILAYAQNQLDRTVRRWLLALDFSLETVITPTAAPRVRILGMDKQMDRAISRSRWFSTAGWVVMAVGFILQIIYKYNQLTPPLTLR